MALAANSPFHHGRDTGLASAREVALRQWPRSGVPRAMHDLPDLLRRGGGAGVQRAIHTRAGIDGLTKQLTRLTATAG